MRKLFLVVMSAICAYAAAAQGFTGLTPHVDIESLNLPDSLSDATTLKGKQLFLPLQGNKNFYIYPTLDMCTSVTQGRSEAISVIDGETETDTQKNVTTGLCINFGATLVFVPGKKVENRLRVNTLGFAYNVGFIASLEKSEKYDVTCNFLLKAGVEIGNQHGMGVGMDVMAGYGKGKGDIFFYDNIAEDTEPIKSITYTAWTPQFGTQLWFKTGILKEKLQGIEILTFMQFQRTLI